MAAAGSANCDNGPGIPLMSRRRSPISGQLHRPLQPPRPATQQLPPPRRLSTRTGLRALPLLRRRLSDLIDNLKRKKLLHNRNSTAVFSLIGAFRAAGQDAWAEVQPEVAVLEVKGRGLLLTPLCLFHHPGTGPPSLHCIRCLPHPIHDRQPQNDPVSS